MQTRIFYRKVVKHLLLIVICLNIVSFIKGRPISFDQELKEELEEIGVSCTNYEKVCQAGMSLIIEEDRPKVFKACMKKIETLEKCKLPVTTG